VPKLGTANSSPSLSKVETGYLQQVIPGRNGRLMPHRIGIDIQQLEIRNRLCPCQGDHRQKTGAQEQFLKKSRHAGRVPSSWRDVNLW
jgi:hypothetical protein